MQKLTIPTIIVQERIKQFKEQIKKDFEREAEEKFDDGLIPSRNVSFPMAYINSEVARGEDGYLFELIARGREVESVENTAEEVISLIEKQEFSVAEALMFLKYLEEKILTSPVKY